MRYRYIWGDNEMQTERGCWGIWVFGGGGGVKEQYFITHPGGFVIKLR